MCPPRHFEVAYEINPWMSTASPVDPDRAMDQWESLVQLLTAAGAAVEVVPSPLVLSVEEAAVFTANTVAVGPNLVMTACPPRVGRQLEAWGFSVEVAEVSEFLKAGGGVRCLTLALDVELT